MAKEAGITDFTLDTPGTVGIKTHNYASRTGHGSDHVDPLPFLAKWGVSYDKLKHDIKYGVGDVVTPSAPSKPASTPANTSAIQQFKNAGNKFTAYKSFRVDEIKKINGIWQAINYNLAGGKNFNWTLNGIPLDIVDNVTRGNSAPTKVGDQIKFMNGYNLGTIDQYDNASNGVGIVEGKYGMVWYNADALLKL